VLTVHIAFSMLHAYLPFGKTFKTFSHRVQLIKQNTTVLEFRPALKWRMALFKIPINGFQIINCILKKNTFVLLPDFH